MNTPKANRQMIIVAGCAGSGKSTLGKELAKKLGYTYIDKDTLTGEFADYALMEGGSYKGDRESGFYQSEIRPIEYRTCFYLAKEILDCGSDVVLVIPFVRQIQNISEWYKIADTYGFDDMYTIKFIWIKHDIKWEKKNIEQRDAVRDNYKLKNWDEYAKSVEGVKPDHFYSAYVYEPCTTRLDDVIKHLHL